MDLTPPSLLVLEYGQLDEDFTFTWSAIDDFPDTYNIIINEVPIEEGKWHSDNIDTFVYSPSMTGNYTLIISIYDSSGNILQYSLDFNYNLDQEVGFLNFTNNGVFITSILAVIFSIRYRKK